MNILKKIRSSMWYWWLHSILYGFYRKNGLQKANALAYVVLVSFVPVCVSTAIIITQIVPSRVYLHYESKILKSYFPGIGSELSSYINVFQSHAWSLSIINVMFLVVITLLMINSIRSNLDQLLEVNRKKSNVSVKIGIIILLFFGVIGLGFGLIWLKEVLKLYILVDLVRHHNTILVLLSYFNSVVAFSIIYKFFPHTKVRMYDAFVAGSIVAVIFEVAKCVFMLYFNYVSIAHVLYGSLVIIPLFLLWLDIVAVIFLLGAQIIFVRQRYRIKFRRRE